MASSTNVFVLTDQPPTLRIDGERAAEQIQQFLREYAAYKRRHAEDGVQIPRLDQLMSEEDLEMLRTMLTGLYEQDDPILHPEDYRALEGSDDEEEPDDAEALEARRRAQRAAARGETIKLSEVLPSEETGSKEAAAAATPRSSKKTQAQKRIRDRRAAFEKTIFSEESIMGGLRLVYGPQNFQQAGAVLSEIKMKKNIQHYSTPQPAIEYCARYDIALQWIRDIGLSEKAIIKRFIKGVQPGDLASELDLREFKDFQKLKNYFAQTYFGNYRSYLLLRASGLNIEDAPSKKNAGAALDCYNCSAACLALIEAV